MSRTEASHFQPLLIRASAGTGKTFALTNRYLGLLDQGVEPVDVLATTFTRKAAGEILDRIVLRLAEAADADAACRELGRHLGDPSLTPARAGELLSVVVANLHRLRVGTLDAFFAQVARCLTLELGLPPGWQIVEELDDQLLRTEAIEALLRGEQTDDLLTLVHLLTKGEASRGVAELVRDTVDGLYDLFRQTEAEAWHQVPRPKRLPAAELGELISELQSAELPEGRQAKARSADVLLATAGDWETFIAKGLAAKIAAGEREYYRKPIPETVVALYERLLDEARATLLDATARQTEGTHQLLSRFDAEYRRLKQQRRSLRFDDVTSHLARAAATGQADRLAFRLDGAVEHLLLDEFQDTAPLQWQVLRPLAQRVADGTPRRSLFCVGDVKQAIYGWRGGVAEIFDALTDQLPSLNEDALHTSYRSSPIIIDFVNHLFTHVAMHPSLDRLETGVQRWCERFDEHSTARGELPGYVALETAPLPAEGVKQQEATLDLAAQRIAELARAAPRRTIGVLTRTNKAVAALIYRLRRLGVAASEEGGNPLTDSAAVRSVLSLLRLADHPGDDVARFHLAHCPLGEALDYRDHRDTPATLDLAQQVRRRLLDDGYGTSVHGWATSLADRCSRREWSRLAQLVELAYQYQQRATLRTDDFRRLIESRRVADPTGDRVRVMTVFQAKGLQFDAVVLPELDGRLVGQAEQVVVDRPDPAAAPNCVCRYVNRKLQRLLPQRFRRMFEQWTDREVVESLCVLYVAVTRSVHALHMIVAPAGAREKTVPKTFAGLLRAALAEQAAAEPQNVLFEHGDRRWHEQADDDTTAETAPPPDAPLAVRLAPMDTPRRRGVPRSSPSSLEGGPHVQLAELFRSNRAALDRGTIVHAWLEQIRWLDDGLPTSERLRQVALRVVQRPLGVERLLDEFQQMLRGPALSRLLHRAAYESAERLPLPKQVIDRLATGPVQAEVRAEQRFVVRDEGALLTGSIDRLVLLMRDGAAVAADVIDFKTDALSADDPAALAERTEFYRPQLDAYRRAVAQMHALPLECVAARLAFVGPDVVQRL